MKYDETYEEYHLNDKTHQLVFSKKCVDIFQFNNRHVSIDEGCAKVHQRFQVCATEFAKVFKYATEFAKVHHSVCKAFIYGSLLGGGDINYFDADNMICMQTTLIEHDLHAGNID